MSEVTKAYPVFDCDAHVVELPEMWEYLSKREQEIVRPWFWPDGNYVVVNGDQQSLAIWGLGHLGVRLGFPSDGRRSVSIVEVSGPGTNKRIIRELFSMLLSDEQCDYCDNAGARDPHARLADMDLQGIDQVMVIPLMMFSAFLFVQDPEARGVDVPRLQRLDPRLVLGPSRPALRRGGGAPPRPAARSRRSRARGRAGLQGRDGAAC